MTQNYFAFDAEKMAEMFKPEQFAKLFGDFKAPGFDPEALVAAQQKNMEALVAANKAAAAGYQDLFRKQVSIFEETMASLRDGMASAGETAGAPDAAAKQTELAKAGFEKAVRNMTDLAEAAKKANTEAFEIVSARVRESVEELKALSSKP